jgi:hypothetical protein
MKSILIKLMLVLALTVVNVIAATPGSDCSVRAEAPLLGDFTFPGSVDSSGQRCGLPDGEINILGIIIIPAPSGLPCGLMGETATAGISVSLEVICPN